MPRRKIFYLPLVFTLVFISLVLTYLFLLKKEVSLPLVGRIGETKNTSLVPLLKAPRLKAGERFVVKVPNPSFEVDEACLDFWSEIERLDLTYISDATQGGRNIATLPNSAKCRKIPPELLFVQKDYNQKCLSRNPTTETSERVSTECVVAMYFLRAGISSWNNRDQKLSEITDLRLLTDKLFMAFTKMFGETPDTAELIEVSKRILEVDPHVYGARKAILIAGTMQGLTDETKKGDANYWEAFLPQLSDARAINPEDPELVEIERAIRTRGFTPELAREDALTQVQAEPGSAPAHRYLAYAEWKAGNREASRQALQQAMSLEPQNAELQSVWRAIQSDAASSDDFKMNLTLGLRFDDIVK